MKNIFAQITIWKIILLANLILIAQTKLTVQKMNEILHQLNMFGSAAKCFTAEQDYACTYQKVKWHWEALECKAKTCLNHFNFLPYIGGRTDLHRVTILKSPKVRCLILKKGVGSKNGTRYKCADRIYRLFIEPRKENIQLMKDLSKVTMDDVLKKMESLYTLRHEIITIGQKRLLKLNTVNQDVQKKYWELQDIVKKKIEVFEIDEKEGKQMERITFYTFNEISDTIETKLYYKGKGNDTKFQYQDFKLMKKKDAAFKAFSRLMEKLGVDEKVKWDADELRSHWKYARLAKELVFPKMVKWEEYIATNKKYFQQFNIQNW